MTIDQYEQLEWSATTWVLLQMGMTLFVFGVVILFVVMVYRAGEATLAPQPEAKPDPEALAATAPGGPVDVEVEQADVPQVESAVPVS